MKCLAPLLLLTSVLLSACNGADDIEALNAQLLQIKSRSSGDISPLPEMGVYSPISYTGSNLRSPFRSKEDDFDDDNKATADSALAPNFTREKTSLELIPFERLSMVGSIQFDNDKHPSALIDDGHGQVHKITIHDFLGQNFGKVADVSHEKVIIEETVQDELGNWVKRTRQLTLRFN
ncbi:MAG: hypothetical protein CMI12_10525 [Oceanospirillum sp.]|nr:hypothetical protein [Oceanospirillum sp.]